MNIETKCFKILAVVTFVNHQILFKVHDLNIEFSQTNLHMYPNRDDGNQKTEETDGMGERKAKEGGFWWHTDEVEVNYENVAG